MYFCYIFPESKNSTYNNRVLKDIINRRKFVIFNKKYWYRDTGYSNFDYLLVLYKKVKYHLKEILFALQKSKNTKKLFNLYYSSHNVIKRIFKLIKKWFSYLKSALEFSKQIQLEIIYAVTALHNFI